MLVSFWFGLLASASDLRSISTKTRISKELFCSDTKRKKLKESSTATHRYPKESSPSHPSLVYAMLLGGITWTPPACLRLRSSLNQPNASQAAVKKQRQAPSYSISDEDLESRGFLLRRSAEGLNLDQLNSVFVAVGFPRRDTAKIEVALEHTDALLWVEDEKTRRPVAFARATGDGVFNAIIWDVVVDPSFQSLGLGKAVMERLIQDLQAKGIPNIALYSEPRVLGFYRPLGFVSDPDGIRGMVFIRKHKR